jgi:hypothetical protein
MEISMAKSKQRRDRGKRRYVTFFVTAKWPQTDMCGWKRTPVVVRLAPKVTQI